MLNPLVSVVIPAFNAEENITEALDSVLHQTYRPIEIILVDDGSTDNTAETVRSYKELHIKDDALTYIFQQNSGPSKARNAGIRTAQGEYIAFLDVDDLWMPEKLEKQIDLVRKDPRIDIVFTNVRITKNRKAKIEEFIFFENNKLDRIFFGHDSLVMNPLEKLLYINFMLTPAVLVRKRCFANDIYFDENRRYVEDWELWLKMSLYYTFGYIQDVCVHVKDMDDGLSSDGRGMTLSSIEVLDSFIMAKKNDIESLKLKNSSLSKAIKDSYKWMGYYLMKNNKNYLARTYFKKSLREAFDMKTLFYYFISYLKTA